ncbi:disease resistance protein L6-like [Syzygium oleosum]|uniref:disease resistance protein L6-like n=1 Tax=Syzygium oleosum TaxID=219896 RepID=UPI0024BB44A5|nr:disease resistance protein L6-like [Syzygium oleosum]
MERRDSSSGIMPSTTDRGDVESSLGAEYEVFLNFRGPDTCLSFANCLYHSMDVARIRVLRDKEEINKGKVIRDKLEHAIKSSTICMPIFSRNYASNPDNVKLKTGLYHDALQKHEEKFGYNVLQGWKEALKEAAQIKGRDLKDRGQGEVIRLIGSEVLIKLNEREKNLPNYVVGIHDRVEEVVHLLDEGSPDVRYLLSFQCSRSFRGCQSRPIAKAIIVRNSQLQTSGDFLL